MKKIITVLLILFILIGCSTKNDFNIITYYEDKGITFSLPDNYYLDDDGKNIIYFINEEFNVIGNIDFREFDSNSDYDKFKNTFTIDFKKDYISELDAYKGVDTIGSSTIVSYDFYNENRLNFFEIRFINQSEEFISSILKTVNNNVDIITCEKKDIDYSFSNDWNSYEFNSFSMFLPNNVYMSLFENARYLFIKNDDSFKRFGTLYLDEFTDKEFDYYKNVSPSGSRIKLTDNIYKGDNNCPIYSFINYDKKTISNIEFFEDIDNDFEKQLVDSVKFKK